MNGCSNFHTDNLNATKVFDKMCREGLFRKLKRDVDPGIWRLLYNYYKDSQIVVRVDGSYSESFRTTQGVKQGGILSPFLFNYCIDGLLDRCCNLNFGTMIGKSNIS